MKVRDLMTKNVASIRASEQLSAAAKLMWDCDCGALPVLDDMGVRTIGMLTDRDICMAAWMQDRPPSAIPVLHAMSQALVRCAPDDSISVAEDTMRSKQIRRLPVLDGDGRLVGIISLADIAREVERERRRGAREVAPDEVSTTLASICEPRQAV